LYKISRIGKSIETKQITVARKRGIGLIANGHSGEENGLELMVCNNVDVLNVTELHALKD
jgi:hypothetical protein